MVAQTVFPKLQDAVPEARVGLIPPMVILVVDDDELVRRVVTELLEEAKLSVIEALSGAEALDLIRSRSDLDLVISDVNMPQMDGLKLVEEVKSLRPSLPVILMSGRPYQGPPAPFLGKPFTRDRLLACVAHTKAQADAAIGGTVVPPSPRL